MWIILFPPNLGMETSCPFAAAALRVQNVQQPSQCETKPLQTFSCNWIKMLLLPKEALCMSKRGGQPSPVLHQWLASSQSNGKKTAKGRLTLNNTGWAWTNPERTALWQPYSKNHQLHSIQVKQKQEQHCNKLSRSPKTETCCNSVENC